MPRKKNERQQLEELNAALTDAVVSEILKDPAKYLEDLPARERAVLVKRKIFQAKPPSEEQDAQLVNLEQALAEMPNVNDIQKELYALRVICKRHAGQLELAQQEAEMWRQQARHKDTGAGVLAYINTFCKYAEDYFSGLREYFLDHDYVTTVLERLESRNEPTS